MANSVLLGTPILRRLEGKVALITGGSCGIGECTARIFVQQGAKVVIADIQDEPGQTVVESLGKSNSLYIHCDVTNEDHVKDAVDKTVSTYGKLDIMFNNAGYIDPRKPRILDNLKSDFERVLAVNVTGVFLGMKHAARVMVPAKSGCILSNASVDSYIGGAGSHAYTASKHAVLGLTKNLTAELGQFGIRVNCLSPYGVATSLLKSYVGMENSDDDLEGTTTENGNLKGVTLKGEDVANAALSLASDEAKYLDSDSAAPPKQAWRRKLNSHASILKEFSVTFMEAIKMVRLGIRLWSYVREEASQGRKAPIDPFTRESCKPSASQGVPLGGMGSGSISRGSRGEFRSFQIVPGTCDTSPIMANQFSIFLSRDGGSKKYASVLFPGKHENMGQSSYEGLSSWGWNLSGHNSTYHALFPRAWTVYDGEPDPELKVSCRQISPFIPHNYQDSSLPTTVFVYTLVNTGKERAKVSLLFTWAVLNSIGGISHLSGDHVNEPFIAEDGVSGVLLHHKTSKGNHPVTFAVAACETQNVSVTVLPSFGLDEGSYPTARAMWANMAQDGYFDRDNFDAGPSMPSSPGETRCAAVSASAWVEPHGKCTVAFALAWSSPKVKFNKGKSYHSTPFCCSKFSIWSFLTKKSKGASPTTYSSTTTSAS